MTREARAWALVVLVALLAACPEPRSAPEPAPDFDLERVGGGRVRLADFEGHLVLLDFWATWCAPCVGEIPELNAFWEEHRDRGVEVLAISVDEDPEADLAGWLRDNGARYPAAAGDTRLAMAYGAAAFPFHVLISPEGEVLQRLPPGFHDRDELRALAAPYLD